MRFTATYTGDGFANATGGLKRGVTHLGAAQLTLAADLDSVLPWKGTHAFVHTLTTFGGRPSGFAGDAQTLDNLEAPTIPFDLYEAWVEQELFAKRLSLLAGYYDVNSEFDVARTGSLFINSAQGIGSAFGLSGRNGPSVFPVTSFGGRVKVVPTAPFYVQAAVLDGVPSDLGGPAGLRFFDSGDGLLVVGEAGGYVGLVTPQEPGPGAHLRYILREEHPEYRAKLAVGAWAYTAPSLDLTAEAAGDPHGPSHRDHGVYGLIDVHLLRDQPGTPQGLWAFARVGTAAPRVNRFPFFIGGGLSYRGPFPGRDDDEVGVAVAVARAGDPLREARRLRGHATADAETAWELTYLAPITTWLTLQADMQYIVHPSADPSVPNALAFLLRYQIEF